MMALTAPYIPIPREPSLHPEPHCTGPASLIPLHWPCIPIPTALALHPSPHCTVPERCHANYGAGVTDFSSLNAVMYI